MLTMATMNNSASSQVKEKNTVPNLKSIGTSLLDNNLQNKIIASQVAANAKQPKFKIENSTLSQSMWCKEQVDGDIACELDYENEMPQVTFSIDQLA